MSPIKANPHENGLETHMKMDKNSFWNRTITLAVSAESINQSHVRKLARRNACGSAGPSELLEKRKKIGE